MFQPVKMIWKSNVPIKVHVLGWIIASGRVNTSNLVQRRRFNVCISPHSCICAKKRQNLEVNCFYIVHNFIRIVAVVAVSQGGKG